MRYFNAKPTLQANNTELQSSLRSLQSFDDVASMLEITSKHLHYILFEIGISSYYKCFEIPKKNGESRKIWAPKGSLKILQDKLNGLTP